LRENVTSYTKPEVHNLSQRHAPEEDRETATINMHKNLVKFGHVVSEICEWTDRDMLVEIFRTRPGVTELGRSAVMY